MGPACEPPPQGSSRAEGWIEKTFPRQKWQPHTCRRGQMKGTKVDLEVKPGNPGTQTPPPRLAHSRSRVLPFVRTLAPPRVASSPPSPTSDISKVNSTHQPCSPPQSENGCSENSQPTSGTRAQIKGGPVPIRPRLVSSQILTVIKDSYWSLVFKRQITKKLKPPHKKLAKVSWVQLGFWGQPKPAMFQPHRDKKGLPQIPKAADNSGV